MENVEPIGSKKGRVEEFIFAEERCEESEHGINVSWILASRDVGEDEWEGLVLTEKELERKDLGSLHWFAVLSNLYIEVLTPNMKSVLDEEGGHSLLCFFRCAQIDCEFIRHWSCIDVSHWNLGHGVLFISRGLCERSLGVRNAFFDVWIPHEKLFLYDLWRHDSKLIDNLYLSFSELISVERKWSHDSIYTLELDVQRVLFVRHEYIIRVIDRMDHMPIQIDFDGSLMNAESEMHELSYFDFIVQLCSVPRLVCLIAVIDVEHLFQLHVIVIELSDFLELIFVFIIVVVQPISDWFLFVLSVDGQSDLQETEAFIVNDSEKTHVLIEFLQSDPIVDREAKSSRGKVLDVLRKDDLFLDLLSCSALSNEIVKLEGVWGLFEVHHIVKTSNLKCLLNRLNELWI
jgi:hypothetical protein